LRQYKKRVKIKKDNGKIKKIYQYITAFDEIEEKKSMWVLVDKRKVQKTLKKT